MTKWEHDTSHTNDDGYKELEDEDSYYQPANVSNLHELFNDTPNLDSSSEGSISSNNATTIPDNVDRIRVLTWNIGNKFNSPDDYIQLFYNGVYSFMALQEPQPSHLFDAN